MSRCNQDAVLTPYHCTSSYSCHFKCFVYHFLIFPVSTSSTILPPKAKSQNLFFDISSFLPFSISPVSASSTTSPPNAPSEKPTVPPEKPATATNAKIQNGVGATGLKVVSGGGKLKLRRPPLQPRRHTVTVGESVETKEKVWLFHFSLSLFSFFLSFFLSFRWGQTQVAPAARATAETHGDGGGECGD